MRAALDHRDDRHARAELALLRLDAEDAGVGALERVEHAPPARAVSGRGDHVLDQHAVAGAPTSSSAAAMLAATSPLASSAISATLLAALDAEAHFDGVVRAGREIS